NTVSRMCRARAPRSSRVFISNSILVIGVTVNSVGVHARITLQSVSPAASETSWPVFASFRTFQTPVADSHTRRDAQDDQRCDNDSPRLTGRKRRPQACHAAYLESQKKSKEPYNTHHNRGGKPAHHCPTCNQVNKKRNNPAF